MIKPLYRRNNRAAVTANPQSAPISCNRSVKTVRWKIESVMKWHDFIRHLRTKTGLKREWEQLHMALWLLIFVLCSRFSRNLPTFHKTCNPQIRTQWSKLTRSFSICVWLLWADINPVARHWPPSASERCSVTAAGMKHVPLLIHSHVHSSAANCVMQPWQREKPCAWCVEMQLVCFQSHGVETSDRYVTAAVLGCFLKEWDAVWQKLCSKP